MKTATRKAHAVAAKARIDLTRHYVDLVLSECVDVPVPAALANEHDQTSDLSFRLLTPECVEQIEVHEQLNGFSMHNEVLPLFVGGREAEARGRAPKEVDRLYLARDSIVDGGLCLRSTAPRPTHPLLQPHNVE